MRVRGEIGAEQRDSTTTTMRCLPATGCYIRDITQPLAAAGQSPSGHNGQREQGHSTAATLLLLLRPSLSLSLRVSNLSAWAALFSNPPPFFSGTLTCNSLTYTYTYTYSDLRSCLLCDTGVFLAREFSFLHSEKSCDFFFIVFFSLSHSFFEYKRLRRSRARARFVALLQKLTTPVPK